MTEPAPRRRPAPTFHRVTVFDVTQLTPRMRRITFTGDALSGYPNDGPGTHFKLLLPSAGTDEVQLPTTGPDGVQWPDGPRPILRTYTPRSVDTENQRLVVDFALHDDGGPASTWAAAATVGDTVVVTGGRGAYRIDPTADWTLLVADETALPAVATIIENAPTGSRIRLLAEVINADEQLNFETAADLEVTWLHRLEAGARSGVLAADAVQDAEFPIGTGAFWIGLEAAAMRTVRAHLIKERGLAQEAIHSRGYWRYGVADHPDHDTGEDS
jgi:NADPH-dependent ferric siderophore reductase